MSGCGYAFVRDEQRASCPNLLREVADASEGALSKNNASPRLIVKCGQQRQSVGKVMGIRLHHEGLRLRSCLLVQVPTVAASLAESGAAAAGMFLTQQHDLKFHKLRAVLSLFPPIQRLEIVASRLVLAGLSSV